MHMSGFGWRGVAGLGCSIKRKREHGCERESEIKCELRSGVPEKSPPTYYIEPSQFEGDEAFAAGADEIFESESEALDAAFYLARMNDQNVTIDVRKRQGDPSGKADGHHAIASGI